MGTVSTATRKRSVKPGDEPNTGAADRAGAGHPTEATGERSGPSNNGDGRVRPRFIDRRSVFIVVCLIALAGVAGTVGFGMAWSNGNAQQTGEAQAKSTAATFLTALTNFDAKSIDADFSQITSMATGDFSSQADKFFGSNIRQKLEAALATSRVRSATSTSSPTVAGRLRCIRSSTRSTPTTRARRPSRTFCGSW